MRTTREEVEKEFNAICWECERDFDEKELYLQHGWVAFSTKGGRVVHSPSRQREAWGTGVGQAGTDKDAVE